MDRESHRRNESSASKSSGSLVRIKSIAIDINCPPMDEEEEEIESPKHEHFSIRGFVAETRKKDMKKCLPFASEGDDVDNNINLPPLSAPQFRRWQCLECVSDLAHQKSSTLEMILAEKTDAGTSSYQNIVIGEKQNIGINEHGSRDSRDVDYNYPSDKLIVFNPQCTEGHKAAKNVMNDIERACITDKANPVQIQTQRNNTPADEPDNVSSGSDEFVFSALPHKRKPKLRSLAEIINEDKSLKTKSTQIEADLNNQSQETEDSSDVAKVTKSHHRKRKLIILDEDDIGPLETDTPIMTAKRSKGPVAEAENINNNNNNNNTNINACKRVEIPETDSERDNRPTLLDLRASAKTQQQNKARKQNSIDINKKTRLADTENRKTVATNETGSGNKGNVGWCFKNSLFGKQMENVSDLLKGKKRSEEGDDDGFYVPPSNKSGPGDCNVQKKVPFLDLSLSSFTGSETNSEKQETSRKHTGIPDLNESFVEKPSMADPTIHENLDISALSVKESVREGKRPLVQSIDNNTVGASDDIPMEIVELLAKNQRERSLDNSRKHLTPETIHNPFRGSPYAKTIPGPINFPYTNARGSSSGNIGPVQRFLNFPPSTDSNKSHFGRFSPLTPGQQRMLPYSGPNPTGPGPRSRPSERSDLLWPPRRKNITFDLNGAQNHSVQVQPNGLEDISYKDKTDNNIKGDGKKAVQDRSSIKEGKIGPGRYKSVGSMDTYSNETIPAMQLLSLMDQGMVSGSTYKVGQSNFTDRQFSPCEHHPRPNTNGIQQSDPFVSSSSFFAQSGRSKDFPTVLNRYSVDSSKQPFPQAAQMPPPQQNGNSKAINLAGPSNLAPQSPTSYPDLGVCTLNRNPADFSLPEAKNEFMISAKDLNPKKRNSSKEKSRAGNVEGPKRQRGKKDSSRKENPRK